MKNSPNATRFWKRVSLAALASTLCFSGALVPPVPASANPIVISQASNGWDTVLQAARLLNANQQVTDLVLQLDVLGKPSTSYANAVYQVFAMKNGNWVQVYNTTGARLISDSTGRLTLPPEVIPLSVIRKELGEDVDLSSLELKSVVLLRYDERGGQRDQRVQFERVQSYSNLAQTYTSQLISSQTVVQQTTTTTQTTTVSTRQSTGSSYNTACSSGYVQRPNAQPGNFTLAIAQRKINLSEVIARVSVLSQRSDGYLQEQFIGDYRYKMNQKARFIDGLKEGDRVIVRLFSPQKALIGYTAFDLLPDHSLVNLLLSDNPTGKRLIRTVYGLDGNDDGAIDSGKTIYSYFTQVTGSQFSDSRVKFLDYIPNGNLGFFQLNGVPNVSQPVYSCSFLNGNFALIDHSYRIFTSNLAPALVALPGQVVQIINISSSSLSIYEVTRQIVVYREVGYTEGRVTRIDYDDDDNDDDDDDKKRGKVRRRNCNQGRGNGSEGCDPGNSRPHGGSNDEGDRSTGGGNRGRKK